MAIPLYSHTDVLPRFPTSTDVSTTTCLCPSDFSCWDPSKFSFYRRLPRFSPTDVLTMIFRWRSYLFFLIEISAYRRSLHETFLLTHLKYLSFQGPSDLPTFFQRFTLLESIQNIFLPTLVLVYNTSKLANTVVSIHNISRFSLNKKWIFKGGPYFTI